MRDRWNNTFLGRLVRRDPWLGWLFIGFAVVQSAAQSLTAEVTPFFLYGMYSDKIHPTPEYVRVTCNVDGRPLTQAEMPRYAGELFFSTLYRLEDLDAHRYDDLFEPFIAERFGGLPAERQRALSEALSFAPEDTAALGRWMVRYLGRVLDKPVQRVVIAREKYTYQDARPVLMDRSTLLIAHVQR
ncbi:MAG: hypothetical protein JNM62_09685 [Flavobacteriales bacterium]|nr:hypothetical protein [Flavobacteriales bacterium]